MQAQNPRFGVPVGGEHLARRGAQPVQLEQRHTRGVRGQARSEPGVTGLQVGERAAIGRGQEQIPERVRHALLRVSTRHNIPAARLIKRVPVLPPPLLRPLVQWPQSPVCQFLVYHAAPVRVLMYLRQPRPEAVRVVRQFVRQCAVHDVDRNKVVGVQTVHLNDGLPVASANAAQSVFGACAEPLSR